jgi:hypothetical protein
MKSVGMSVSESWPGERGLMKKSLERGEQIGFASALRLDVTLSRVLLSL